VRSRENLPARPPRANRYRLGAQNRGQSGNRPNAPPTVFAVDRCPPCPLNGGPPIVHSPVPTYLGLVHQRKAPVREQGGAPQPPRAKQRRWRCAWCGSWPWQPALSLRSCWREGPTLGSNRVRLAEARRTLAGPLFYSGRIDAGNLATTLVPRPGPEST
jgi:hypothetical protein